MKLIFVLDNVRSAFNVGSIFRTADGVGAGIHLIGITPVPNKEKKLDKTSLSAIDYVEWKYFDDENTWFKYKTTFRGKDSKPDVIISVEENQNLETISLFNLSKKLDPTQFENIYVIFGHEINGVSEFLQNKSDFILRIPMNGFKNSLNVATCVGIVGYRIKEILDTLTSQKQV